MKKSGPASKLTPEVQKCVVEALSNGNPRRTAALLSGISTTTFYAWLEEARANPEGTCAEFLRAIENAEAEYQAEMNRVVFERIVGAKPTCTHTTTRKFYRPAVNPDGTTLDENANPVVRLEKMIEETVVTKGMNQRFASDWIRRHYLGRDPEYDDASD